MLVHTHKHTKAQNRWVGNKRQREMGEEERKREAFTFVIFQITRSEENIPNVQGYRSRMKSEYRTLTLWGASVGGSIG